MSYTQPIFTRTYERVAAVPASDVGNVTSPTVLGYLICRSRVNGELLLSDDLARAGKQILVRHLESDRLAQDSL